MKSNQAWMFSDGATKATTFEGLNSAAIALLLSTAKSSYTYNLLKWDDTGTPVLYMDLELVLEAFSNTCAPKPFWIMTSQQSVAHSRNINAGDEGSGSWHISTVVPHLCDNFNFSWAPYLIILRRDLSTKEVHFDWMKTELNSPLPFFVVFPNALMNFTSVFLAVMTTGACQQRPKFGWVLVMLYVHPLSRQLVYQPQKCQIQHFHNLLG